MTQNTKTQAEMDAWTMACSLLVGLHKSAKVALEERTAIVEVGKGNPFHPGISQANQICEMMNNAKQDFSIEMRRIARSSGLTLPELD